MALGMKGWIAGAGLLLSGVAVVLVPPSRADGPEKGQSTQARNIWAELAGELRGEVWAYQHLQWRDSLVHELRKGVEEGRSVILGTPPETADSLKGRLATAVEYHLQQLDATEPVIPVGVFFVPRTQYLPPGVPSIYASSTGYPAYYVARDGENPYCIIAAPYQNDVEGDQPSWATDPLTRRIGTFARMSARDIGMVNTLGYCGHYVRYGLPGPELRAWLQDGAFRFGGSEGYEMRFLLQEGPHRVRGPFGTLNYLTRALTPRGLACIQGVRDACMDIVLKPLPPGTRTAEDSSPVDYYGNPGRIGSDLDIFETTLFGDLEEEFGPDMFRRFWVSPLEPERAFREAFGEPMDLWVMKWIRGYLQPAPRGPGVPVQATLLVFLTLGILAGGAVRMARR